MDKITSHGGTVVSVTKDEERLLEVYESTDLTVGQIQKFGSMDSETAEVVEAVIDLADDGSELKPRQRVKQGKSKHLALSFIEAAEGPVTNSQISDSDKWPYEEGTVSSATHRLSEAGFIARQKTEIPSKRYAYVVTAKGQEEIAELGRCGGVEDGWNKRKEQITNWSADRQ